MIETYFKYAGFWKRFAAFIIDSIILSTVKVVLFIPIWLFSAGFWLNFDQWSDTKEFVSISRNLKSPEDFVTIIATVITFLILGILILLIQWLYYAIMESSKLQASVGKIVLRIKVTDLTGERISFGRATGRFFGKILSAMLFMLGFIMAAFSQKKQALHDAIAGCLVVNLDYNRFESITEELK